MTIENFMTKDVLTIPKETPIYDALNLMEKNQLHRLPVVEGKKLIGLLTMSGVKSALPSTATSLSVYEVNYLLNQTTVKEIMVKDVITIDPDAQLEDGIFKMRQHEIGVLPVVKDELLVGLITNNDIFDAFLNITAYDKPGVKVTIKIEKDAPGVLAKLTKILAEYHYFIVTLVVLRKEEPIVELKITNGEEKELLTLLEENNFNVIAAKTYI